MVMFGQILTGGLVDIIIPLLIGNGLNQGPGKYCDVVYTIKF